MIGRQQQLLRVDFEIPPSHEVLMSKLRDYRRMLAETDVVILSDYGKGGLTHIARMIGLARRAGKAVLVDPKGDDYSRYRGASLITPNRAEFREVAGTWKNEADLTARAQRLRRELGVKAVLVTRSEEGMTLYQAGERLHWRFGTREAVPTEEWITLGEDDVRRLDFAAPDPPGDAAASDHVAEGDIDRGWLLADADAA